jgi:hypothetical protein
MENVMVTGNRDHPSTMALDKSGGEDSDYNLARDLFASLNWIERLHKCATLAEEYGLFQDASDFRKEHFEECKKRTKVLDRISSKRSG